MKGLLLKDFYNLKVYFKNILIVILFLGIYAIYTKSIGILAGIIPFLSIMSISSFSYDDYGKWDIYALTLPITKNKMVLAKYIYSIILTVIATAIVLVVGLILSGMQNSIETLSLAGATSLVGLILCSIILPVVYKYGAEKGRIMMFAVVLVLVMGITGVGMLGSYLNISFPNEQVMTTILYLLPLIVVILMYFSYRLSCRFFKKREI